MKSQTTEDEILASSQGQQKLKDSWKLWQLIGEKQERVEFLLKMLENKPDHRVWLLDAGCGRGEWSKLLGQKGYQVVGADVSRAYMNTASNGCTIENVSFLVGNMLEIPFKRETFQVCFCKGFLHHFRNVECIIDELSGVIQRGGEFLIYEPNGSNILIRLTEFGKKFVPRKWIQMKSIDTTNETIHPWVSYVNSLKAKGFKHIKVLFLNSSEQEGRFSGKIFITFLNTFGVVMGMVMFVRFLLLKVSAKIPNQAIKCGQLAIYSRKD